MQRALPLFGLGGGHTQIAALLVDFVRDDFIDVSHLNEVSGAPKFSRLLAQQIADRLAASASATR